MERDTAKEAVRRLSRLESKNLTLRQLLDTLTGDASHNEQVMHRFQERELVLLGAADLPELIEALTTGLRKSFALESVQLVLFDPHEVLSELLSALGVSNGRLPHVRMERDVRRAMQRYPDLHHPWLGRWNPHHQPFPAPALHLHSEALLPLRQPDGIAGFLHLSSGICQDRCRLFDHAARHFSSLLRSGFNATDPTGSQFRVWPDHRAGLAAFACS